MKAFVSSFLGFLLALSVILTATVWFNGQRFAMHKANGHPTALYCGVMRALSYPSMQTGERWLCEVVLDRGGDLIHFDDHTRTN